MISTIFSEHKASFSKEKKSGSAFIKYLFSAIIIAASGELSAQEVFDNTATGPYSVNTQVSNLYDLTLSNTSSWQNDFKNANNTAYKLQGTAATGTVDRFGNASQALAFTGYQNLIVPPTVVKDIVSNNKGFSVSAWIKVPENGKNCQILSFTNPSNGNREDIQLRMKDGYFQVLKYSNIAQKKIVMGQARYKISYTNDNTGQEIFPGPDEYGAGYIYFMLTSDKNSTRIYYSRPGGRLYSNYFWFGLSDLLTNNHNITFGTVNNQQGAILSAVDDIMVYREMLTPELANNHFLVQSPLYPSRSYIVRNFQNKPIAPDSDRGIYNDGYIKAIAALNPSEGIYSSARWFLPTRQPSGGKGLISFINAKSSKPIARWNANSGNYFYQEDADFSSDRQLFEPNHIIGSPNNLIDSRQNAFNFLVNEYRSDNYQLGMSGNDLYLQYANRDDNKWSIQGSFNSAVRERFTKVGSKGIRFTNFGTKQSMAVYNSSLNTYYLYQNSSDYEPIILENRASGFSNTDYKYGYENFVFHNSSNSLTLSLTDGVRSTRDQGYLWFDDYPPAIFQLSFVKNDPNGKPLYLIRIHNGYGATILIPNYTTGGLTYVTQNKINEDGPQYPDNYLWSVNVTFDKDDGDIVVAKKPREITKAGNIEVQSLNVYPNPVKENATIEYTLAQTGAVKVYISSATGALVKTVKDGTQNKGTYKEDLNTSGWTSGVYFCTLQVNGQVVQTKKIIVQ